jgi:hypothetical protein
MLAPFLVNGSKANLVSVALATLLGALIGRAILRALSKG